MTKAVSRAEARRRKQKVAPAEARSGPPERQLAIVRTRPPENVMPTPERTSHGVIVAADKDKPALALDPLALMLKHRGITEAEEHAGRTYANLSWVAHRSMGIRSHVSCLAGGVGGYDGAEGAARAEREWFQVTTLLPIVTRAYLDRTVIDGEVPRSKIALRHVRNALRLLTRYWG